MEMKTSWTRVKEKKSKTKCKKEEALFYGIADIKVDRLKLLRAEQF